MASELQQIVDALGARLQRAVAIDDPRMRLQVYSPHYGDVDAARMDSILHREAPADAVEWVLSQGIAKADKPVRLPGNADLELLPRVCAPIRCQSLLLGYLWLIDADSALDDDDLAAAAAAAEAAGVVMYREQLLRELDRGRERELLRDLLSDDAPLRAEAVRDLADRELFAAAADVAAIVVQPVSSSAQLPDDQIRIAIDLTLDHGRRAVSARRSLQLARPTHGVVLVAVDDAAVSSGGLPALAERLRETLASGLPEGWRALVGIGDEQPHLAEAVVSYRQARQAVRVAEIVPLYGPVARWSDMGIYRTLAHLPAEELTSRALHPGLVKLFSADGGEPLVETLECYLDRAGDAKATAAALVIHRTSLYYRLNRIEEIAGVSLRSGEDRLALHLGLKMARLADIHPLQQGAGGA